MLAKFSKTLDKFQRKTGKIGQNSAKIAKIRPKLNFGIPRHDESIDSIPEGTLSSALNIDIECLH